MKHTAFFLIVLFSSCQKTIYFTEDLRKVVDVNKLDMKKIQFYNSSNMTLRRDVSSEEAEVAKGKITISNGKIVEEIFLKRETNGICKAFTTQAVIVGFEQGENKGFEFEHLGDYYVLQTKSQKNNFINYDLKQYELIEGTGCKLKVKKSQFRRYQKSVRRLKGVKVE